MNPQAHIRPCSSCFGTPARGVVSEAFKDDAAAFRRHTLLVQVGCAPSLCFRRDGTRYVCHSPAAAGSR